MKEVLNLQGSIITTIVVVEIAPAFEVVSVSGVLVGDTVVDTDPLVSMVVSAHAVVQHFPS